MSRLMNGLESNGQLSQSWIPAADVWETDKEVVYAFDLPGISEDKISVELDDGALTVTGSREREQTDADSTVFRSERRFGTFTRTVGVPQGTTEEHVRADYANGVLEIHIAKPEQPKPRTIAIGSSPKTIEGESKRTDN
jgi:HSP20 family protein